MRLWAVCSCVKGENWQVCGRRIYFGVCLVCVLLASLFVEDLILHGQRIDVWGNERFLAVFLEKETLGQTVGYSSCIQYLIF
jgi:hypothetical protein